MSAQRKKYLQLADNANEARSKIFYKLMADVAPSVSDMCRKNVNQVGVSTVYDIGLRAASAILLEVALNLAGEDLDVERLLADFSKVIKQSLSGMKTLGPALCTPKMDA